MLQHGDVGAMQNLLSSDRSGINIKDKESGWTPLHWWVESGNEDMVKLLLNAGADVNIINIEEETSDQLSLASLDIIYMIVKHRKGKGSCLSAFTNTLNPDTE